MDSDAPCGHMELGIRGLIRYLQLMEAPRPTIDCLDGGHRDYGMLGRTEEFLCIPWRCSTAQCATCLPIRQAKYLRSAYRHFLGYREVDERGRPSRVLPVCLKPSHGFRAHPGALCTREMARSAGGMYSVVYLTRWDTHRRSTIRRGHSGMVVRLPTGDVLAIGTDPKLPGARYVRKPAREELIYRAVHAAVWERAGDKPIRFYGGWKLLEEEASQWQYLVSGELDQTALEDELGRAGLGYMWLGGLCYIKQLPKGRGVDWLKDIVAGARRKRRMIVEEAQREHDTSLLTGRSPEDH